jgi:hypothetical protein
VSARRRTPTVDENKRTAVFDKSKHVRRDASEYPEIEPTVVDGPLVQALREDPGSLTGPTTIHDKETLVDRPADKRTGPTVLARPVPANVRAAAAERDAMAKRDATGPAPAISRRDATGPAPAMSKRDGTGPAPAMSKRDGTGPAQAMSTEDASGPVKAISMKDASGPVKAISMKDAPGPMQAISMKDATGALQAISMKTPGQAATSASAPNATPMLARPKLRGRAEVAPASQQNLGHVAPPYDPDEARARQVREYVIWSCVAVILASAIALVVWFVAR